MPPSPPPSLSAHDQWAANRNASLPVLPAKPKSTSRKRQQSNADESANKRNKRVVNNSDDGMDDATMDAAIAVEEANEAGKGGKKGKKAKKTGAKGKTMRKVWADRQHEDEIENAKGTPAHLQPCVFYFLLF
ncbi:hypothetical protein K443DRAFT_15618 [Laccaria amethystina LaAM-08-1]|uniref:Uncharacterized protein n=1 Tax=Laccaria amethystina LaAM-08-1 TaxID=1095629 RepID=A0A0C9WGT1_9AGAR|nr:hypothetical protein K443DRAFT_15618 [Laccaria amethystina LaAM-08-1]